MEIYYLDRDGVPIAETKIHSQISQHFSQFNFSKNWIGFASFSLLNRYHGNDDFDLVLLTHKDVVVVELKNWHGKVLKSNGNSWFLDDKNMGNSPLVRTQKNVKKLATAFIKSGIKPPYLKALVVLHGEIDTLDLASEERESVLTLDEFFRLSNERDYDQIMPGKPQYKVLYGDFPYYKKFFKTDSVTQRVANVFGFRLDRNPIFSHGTSLFNEFLGQQPNSYAQALIRSWDFSKLDALIDKTTRINVATRESQLYNYLEQNCTTLSLDVLRPISAVDPNSIGLDYEEAFSIKPHFTRLVEYQNKRLRDLTFAERVEIAQAIVSFVAKFHREGITHWDLSSRNFWINDNGQINLTGFIQATFPGFEASNFKDIPSVLYPQNEPLTSSSVAGSASDVFALGKVILEILFKCRSNEDWQGIINSFQFPAEFENKRKNFYLFFSTALNQNQEKRFRDAVEMAEHLKSLCASQDRKKAFYDIEDFERFINLRIHIRDWEELDVIPTADSATEDVTRYHARSVKDQTPVIITEWALPATIARLNDSEKAALYQFLRRLENFQIAGFQEVAKIHAFGFDDKQRTLYLIEYAPSDSLKTLSAWMQSAKMSYTELPEFINICNQMIQEVQNCWSIGYCIESLSIDNFYLENRTPLLRIEHNLKLNGNSEFEDKGQANDIQKLIDILVNIFTTFETNQHVGKDILDRLITIRNARTTPSLDPLIALFSDFEHKDSKNLIQTDTPYIGTLVLETKFYEYIDKILTPNDDGTYFFCALPDKKYPNACRFYFSGKYKQIAFSVNNEAILNTPFFEPCNNKTQAVGIRIRGEIRFVSEEDAYDGDDNYTITDISDIKENKILWDFATQAFNREKSSGAVDPFSVGSVKNCLKVPVYKLWEKILESEENALQTYTVLKVDREEIEGKVVTHLNLSPSFDLTDTADDDILSLEVLSGDKWIQAGRIYSSSALSGNLLSVIEAKRLSNNLDSSDKVRVRSKFEKASIDRRKKALQGLICGSGRIRDLVQYFDPNESIEEKSLQPITDDFSLLDKNCFNEAQREAFKKVISYGPVSLLQGPPGTGKTRFISTLMMFLLQNVPNVKILLTSQSNEAVNNAIEKLHEQLSKYAPDTDRSIVRIGRKDKVSPLVEWYLAQTQEGRFKNKLLRDRKDRIVLLATHLGLPEEFAESVVHVYDSLWTLYLQIKNDFSLTNPTKPNSSTGLARRHFLNAASALSGMDLSNDMSSPRETFDFCIQVVADTFNIINSSAIRKLRQLIEMSIEFENSLGTNDTKFTEFLIQSKSVVAGTLVGLGGRAVNLLKNTFDWVIVDEASRATASELAIAAQVGRHVLLVGDHKQLPPSYGDEIRNELANSLKISRSRVESLLISDFERIFTSPYGKSAGVSLTTQYRMDPEIGQMVSECFYDGILTTGRKPRVESFTRVLPPELQSSSLVWYDTSCSPKHGLENPLSTKSILNKDEATAIVNLLVTLFSNKEFVSEITNQDGTSEPVGVICMYSAQKRKIREFVQLRKELVNYQELIKIDTVDSYQGKENRMIILSTVRQNMKNNAGFLRLANRVNVAVSRAQDALIIFGSIKMWTELKPQPLGRVLSYMRKRNLEPIPFTNLLLQPHD